MVRALAARGQRAVFFAPAGEDLEADLAAVADFPVARCFDAGAGLLDIGGGWRRGDVAVLGQVGLFGEEFGEYEDFFLGGEAGGDCERGGGRGGRWRDWVVFCDLF